MDSDPPTDGVPRAESDAFPRIDDLLRTQPMRYGPAGPDFLPSPSSDMMRSSLALEISSRLSRTTSRTALVSSPSDHADTSRDRIIGHQTTTDRRNISSRTAARRLRAVDRAIAEIARDLRPR